MVVAEVDVAVEAADVVLADVAGHSLILVDKCYSAVGEY